MTSLEIPNKICNKDLQETQKGTSLWVMFIPASVKLSSLWFLFTRLHYILPWNLVSTWVWERRWAGQPDLEMSQKDVSAPAERVKTIVPFCLSRLCLSAWRGLILARACSRWFIKMGPGKTRGPGEKETFTCMHNAHKWERTCGNTTQKNTQKKKIRHKQGSNNQGTAPRLSQHLKVISAWEKNRMDTKYSVVSGPASLFSTSLYHSFLQDS